MLQAALVLRRAMVGTAESCTGGLLATWLTHLAGSSAIYAGGVSAYADRVKVAMLGVDETLLGVHGAVSGPVAEAMARGVRDRLDVTYGLSLTGVAGPGGGTLIKPVGTVYCGVASPRGVRSVALRLVGDRQAIREAAAGRALEELERELTS